MSSNINDLPGVKYMIKPELLMQNWARSTTISVPSDNKFHQLAKIEIPAGDHHLALDVDFRVTKSLPAPYEFHLMLIREDRWVPAVFSRSYGSDKFVPYTHDWQFRAYFTDRIESEQTYNYFLMVKLDSPIRLEAFVEVMNKDIVGLLPPP